MSDEDIRPQGTDMEDEGYRGEASPPPLADGIAVHCAYDALETTENLRRHPRNPNTHPDDQIALLAKIIREQGWRAPITVSTRSGYMTKGHGRLLAAQLLGVSVVPIDRQGYPSEQSELADMLADNQIASYAELAVEDVTKILGELQELAFDVNLAGFDEEALAKIMGTMDDPEDPPPPPGPGGDDSLEESYNILITCKDEEHQTELLERFIKEGMQCKALIY